MNRPLPYALVVPEGSAWEFRLTMAVLALITCIALIVAAAAEA
jgi:hypothetical protein